MRAATRGALPRTGMLLMLAAATVLFGCSQAREQEPDSAPNEGPASAATQPIPDPKVVEIGTQLAGTSWMLLELQSMDDAVGTSRPEDATRFTMRLNDDSTTALRLDCNRATGTWTVEPSAGHSNGRFEFGPLATTSAQCAPPNLDERIAAQLPYVRGYLLRDGRLYLSLMADGGILAWQPYEEHEFRTEPDARLEAAIRAAAPSYTREVLVADAENRRSRYVYGRMDLNGDGRDEVFAYTLGSFFCGTGGCNLFLFRDEGDRYELINEFAISRTPIIVSPRVSEGWHDLIRRESGGGAPAFWVRHSFDGTRYVEAARTPGDREAPEGTHVLTGELSFEKGIPMEPGDTTE